MKVKFIDFEREYNFLKNQISPRIEKIIKTGNFILGEELYEFEQRFAKLCNVRYAVGVNSGTDALFLALRSLGISSGDEVIVPSFTYTATALAVAYTGAKPVFCDIELETFSLNPQDLLAKISTRTKAIIVVHLYGHPALMPEILSIARKKHLAVIEDCAQAHGAKWQNTDGKWQMVGGGGNVGCF
ncbi:MAG TPA: aminotransferase class I/II-fold pyridoxal phosphate-dependent enzyme, partial [Candidatus Omnitrophica bacterium]|nr:aminotransferase class I/II-fold pyridoxal phosphate-dependent enzyme [Candidatus Omnitrophota bacterium]